MSNPQRIVVARYRYIGDTLLTIPFLRALRKQNPNALIHLLVSEDTHAVMAQCPYINEAILFDPRELGFWGSVNLIKQQHYDCAYLLKRSFSSALIMQLAGVPRRIGFDTENRGLLLTRRIPYRDQEQHEAQCFLDLLPDSADDPPDLSLEVWLPSEVQEKAVSLLKPVSGPRVVLHATSTNPAKCWPLSHFQQLAQMLSQEYRAHLYFMGPPQDSKTYDTLLQGLNGSINGNTYNLCGQTSVLESLALLKHMDLVVANDSGMIHMAAAAGTPVVSIFGPMDPLQWRPLFDTATIISHSNLTCHPCRMKITCNNLYPCLTEITPETVFNACKPYLKS